MLRSLAAVFFLPGFFAYAGFHTNDCSGLFSSDLNLAMTSLPRPFSPRVRAEMASQKWFNGQAALDDFRLEQRVIERERRSAMKLRNELILEAADQLGGDWYRLASAVKARVIRGNDFSLSVREMGLLEKVITYDMATFVWLAAEQS